MKKALSKIALGCAVCSIGIAAPVQADSQSQSDQNSQSQNYHSTAAAHAGGHLMRASRLTGCDVIDASGTRIGRIEDIIVNPASGRIDFAVLSLNAAGAASSPSGYSSGSSSSSRYNSSGQSQGSSMNSGGTADTSSSTSESGYSGSSGKLIPVPWSLLHVSAHSSSSSSSISSESSTSTGPMHTFALNVNRSKLEQAPAFDGSHWSQISQSNWREQIYSYYGISPQSATGAAESPSGVSQGQGAEHLTGQEGSPNSSSQNP